MAERQRESEELLHRGAAAFDEGQPVAARRLLTAAIERGAAPDVPLAYLGRLDRLGAPAAAIPEPPLPLPVEAEASPATRSARRHLWGATALVAAGILTVAFMAGFAGAIAESGRLGRGYPRGAARG